MTQEIQKNSYLLLDSRNAPLARGELLTNPDAPTLQVRVLDHKISDVMNHEEIQLVPMGVNGAALLGRIVRSGTITLCWKSSRVWTTICGRICAYPPIFGALSTPSRADGGAGGASRPRI